MNNLVVLLQNVFFQVISISVIYGLGRPVTVSLDAKWSPLLILNAPAPEAVSLVPHAYNGTHRKDRS